MILSEERIEELAKCDDGYGRHYYNQEFTLKVAQEQDTQTRQDTLKEVGEWLTKIAKRTEQPSGIVVGDNNSTGGAVRLTETYYLIAKTHIESLERGVSCPKER